LAWLLVGTTPALAGNLVVSGQFDDPQSIDAWAVTTAPSAEGSISFEPVPDRGDCELSGSALLVTRAVGEQDVEYSSCAGGTVAEELYAVGLELLFPDGVSDGQLRWGVTWFEGVDCTGAALASFWLGPATYAEGWQTLESWNTAWEGSGSARVQIWISSRLGSDPLPVNIDGVFLRPADELFADGFELGEICRWSGGAI
jgi:hypothetical protein